jgi:amino-acid N-acetyltransferase
MEIFKNPEESTVNRLLSDAELPAVDLTPGHLEHFFGYGTLGDVKGVIGLELYGTVALLRSLAVASYERKQGVGRKLVVYAEKHASECGVGVLYLLTTTAEAFFRRLGYERVDRDIVPEAIKKTREYAEVCPTSSTVMVKALSTEQK